MPLKVLIADDHKLMREGLRALMASHAGIEIVAEAEDGRSAVRLALEMKPDVILMDVTMPDLNGVEATRQIKAELPQTKIIALSMHADIRFVQHMLQAGASGYLLKDCDFNDLERAISLAAADKTYLSPDIADTVLKDYIGTLSESKLSPSSVLTIREREVLQLISEGKKTKEIAEDLNISVKTVETHKRQIMLKLNVYSVAKLTKFALREGITTIDM